MKRLLSLAILGLPLLMSARPADPRVTAMTNPDGSVVEIRAFGDEHFNYYTDAKGETLFEKNAKGFWTPVSRNGRILSVTASDLSLLRAETQPMTSRLVSKHRMAALDSDGRSTYPTVCADGQTIPALVILLEFPDTPFTVNDPEKTFERMLNEPGFSDYNAKGSARDYYLATSNGLFNVHFDVAPVVKLKYHHAWYTGWNVDDQGNATMPEPYIRHRRMADAITEALEQLDPVIDFSKYDLDQNGEIDNIFFFYSGFGQADSHDPTTIWPHQGSYYNFQINYDYPDLVVDGVKMRTYACSNELNYIVPSGQKHPWLDGIGAFCHEYGHVLGLPDLYDTSNNALTKVPKKYDIMDTGSYNENSTRPPLFSAYEKWVCKWLDYEDIDEADLYSVGTISTPLNEVQKAYRLRIPRQGPAQRYSNEYFVFETRTHDGWDSSLPEEGLFIWRIDYDAAKWVSNQVNYNTTSRVEMMNSSTSTYAWPGSSNTTWAIPGSNELKFTTSNPRFKIWITDINFDAENKKADFGYNLVTEQVTDAPVLHENVIPVEGSDNSFYLHWDAVPGATNYQLTVTRTDSRGRTVIVNGLNEALVGNVTSYLIDNQTANTTMKQKFTAYVRAIVHAPSAGVSNTYEFIPVEEIEKAQAAVDGIYDDASAIYGAEGCIVAPEGAKVYTLSGTATGKENLPAGVYIVRFGSKAVKVVVK
ncbi:MAG: M6 family metalloprotease domain-containing protein [Muribaculaceae bacterium]|nr:M6 family metalloprotease domain-containing protein [Muribaculaceae bacterium]